MKTIRVLFVKLPCFGGGRPAAVAALTLSLTIMSSVATAAVVTTAYTIMEGGEVDFGSGLHVAGAPLDNAVVTFDYNTSSGQVVATGRVRGTLYWDALFSSGCARVTILFRDVNDGPLAARTIDRCGPGGDANSSANKIAVDESFSSPLLYRIVIRTRELRGGVLIGGADKLFVAPSNKKYETIINGGSARLGYSIPYIFFDIPVDPAEISFNRSNGLMSGAVTGDLFSGRDIGECARTVIDFRDVNAAVLNSRTRDTCGSRTIADSLDSGSLSQIRIRVGDLIFGNFRNVTSRTYDFNGQTGNFEISPAEAAATVNETVVYTFNWTVPEPLNWHDLKTVDLLIRDELGTILLVRFDEASDSFSLFNERAGRFGPAFPAGAAARLQTAYATLHLADASVRPVNSDLGNGPNSPTVQLSLPLSFKPSAAGRAFSVFTAAGDDLGNEDPFALAGTLTVTH